MAIIYVLISQSNMLMAVVFVSWLSLELIIGTVILMKDVFPGHRRNGLMLWVMIVVTELNRDHSPHTP